MASSIVSSHKRGSDLCQIMHSVCQIILAVCGGSGETLMGSPECDKNNPLVRLERSQCYLLRWTSLSLLLLLADNWQTNVTYCGQNSNPRYAEVLSLCTACTCLVCSDFLFPRSFVFAKQSFRCLPTRNGYLSSKSCRQSLCEQEPKGARRYYVCLYHLFVEK